MTSHLGGKEREGRMDRRTFSKYMYGLFFFLINFLSVFTGVANIINKLNGLPFDENDEQLFEVSSQYSFCP
jgi:hypothetical protein